MRNSNNSAGKYKLGFISLTVIVISSMLGGGVFSLPQDTTASPALEPVIVAWIIVGIGIYFITSSSCVLSDLCPDLQVGVYMYAQEDFGSSIGLNVARGYWLMTALGSAAFVVILMGASSQFMSGVLADGNNPSSIIYGSVLVWGYNFLVLSGTKVVGLASTLGTIARFVPLIPPVLLLGVLTNHSDLLKNLRGESSVILSGDGDDVAPIPLLSQILVPMTVMPWVFIGVERAIVLSGRAKNKQDIGKVILIGSLLALIIYMLVFILPFGAMLQVEPTQVSGPSTVGVFTHAAGQRGGWLINAGLIISVLISWLIWTMLCAEVPMVVGQENAFLRVFARTNSKQMANVSLWVSSFAMQAAMLLVYFSNNAWTTVYNISVLMVTPTYITTTLYLTSIYRNGKYNWYVEKGRRLASFSDVLGSLFCLSILYASQIEYAALTPILLTCDLLVFIWSRKEKNDDQPISTKEKLVYLIMLSLRDTTVVALFTGGHLEV